MKLSSLNDWLTLGADIGVLAGIILLAVELQQNTQMMRSQTRDAMTQKTVDWRYMLAGNPELSELFANSEAIMMNPEYDANYFSLAALYEARLRIWENEWYQYQQGLFDESEFSARLLYWGRFFRRKPDFGAYWEGQRANYSESFAEQIDQLQAVAQNR